MSQEHFEGLPQRAIWRLLEEESRTVAGCPAVYRLYEFIFSKPQYFVEVLYGRERARASLGEGMDASALFHALVQGEVTPCTLGDIVEDHRKSAPVSAFFANYL